jgi:hypothetical protein
MNLTWKTETQILTLVSAVSITSLLYVFSNPSKKRSNPKLVVVPGFPIIGNLLNLLPAEKVFLNINDLIDKYGSLLEMFIFSHRIVVVADISVAKEIMMKRPKTFCRPR